MLGKKRLNEDNKKDINKDIKKGMSKKITKIFFNSTNVNRINSNESVKITGDLNNYYNMTRSICSFYVQTKNKKYPTNEFIPCIPFS